MWTCGIDIATQQATPAMQSSVCALFIDRPNGRVRRAGAAGAVRGMPAARRRRAGGRGRA